MLQIGGRALDVRGDVVDGRGKGCWIGGYRGCCGCGWPWAEIPPEGAGDIRDPGVACCWLSAVAEGVRGNELSRPGVFGGSICPGMGNRCLLSGGCANSSLDLASLGGVPPCARGTIGAVSLFAGDTERSETEGRVSSAAGSPF
jgi:hypothetical protein